MNSIETQRIAQFNNPQPDRHSWSTANEIEFIERLARSDDPIAKLRGYLDGAAKRKDFGEIDLKEATRFANAKLAGVRGVAL
ncbi:hypothetical protein AB3X91_08915 [Paraburkholderia sp. BR14263]|uniref:hypothetical protein n=1 Tax=unclassified Paraburkholderia TaxID=2615204 RepID=UPI0034CF4646